MKSVLDDIIEAKKHQVSREKSETGYAFWEKQPFFKRESLSLTSFLTAKDKTGIIAEFKRKSPSKGIINDSAGLEEVTGAYTRHGASGLSILTDHDFFGGSLADLKAARINPVPILRKEFIIDEYQIIEAKGNGADAILLIAACLTPGEVRKFSNFAANLGLESILEIHNQKELDHICDELAIIGVNNRNLKTFDVNMDTSLQLIEKIHGKIPAISESGISDVNAVKKLKEAGFAGFLIGETFMKEKDPGKAFEKFVSGL